MSASEHGGSDRRRGERRAGDEKVRILVVDDHVLFRRGIAGTLAGEDDFEIVGEADDSRSAIDMALEDSPDIILMDSSLPAPGGIETTQRIKRELASTGIIILAGTEDEDDLFGAIKAGAAAFILKTCPMRLRQIRPKGKCSLRTSANVGALSARSLNCAIRNAFAICGRNAL